MVEEAVSPGPQWIVQRVVIVRRMDLARKGNAFPNARTTIVETMVVAAYAVRVSRARPARIISAVRLYAMDCPAGTMDAVEIAESVTRAMTVLKVLV